MHKILKFSLDGLGPCRVESHYNLNVISVGWQNGLKFWAEALDSAEIKIYEFEVLGTGWDIPENFYATFLGTVQGPDGYVYHVFIK